MQGTPSDSIVVTLLGTGSPVPLLSRFGPSTLIEAGGLRLLFDCGRGTMQRLYQVDEDVSSFDKLFLTHLHSDHTTGIPDLWITGYLLQRKDNPLRVWGIQGTTDMISNLKKAFEVDRKIRSDFHGSIDGMRMEAHDIDEGFVYRENGVKVSPFRVNHHDLYSDAPSLGYRIEYKGRSIVLSGDTRYCDNLVKFSAGADLLVHEVAAGPEGEELSDAVNNILSIHTTPEDCGRVFSEVMPRLAVYNHVLQLQGVSLEEMMDRTRRMYSGRVLFGEDMMRIEVDDTIKVL
jgi:ribonuclease Z